MLSHRCKGGGEVLLQVAGTSGSSDIAGVGTLDH